MNIGVRVSFCIILVLSGYMPRSGIPRSYGNFIFSFLRTLHPVFHSGYTNLHSHQQCNRILFSPHPLQHLLLVDFLITAIVTVVKWYLTVVLISIPLKVSAVEHLFISDSVLFHWSICLNRLRCHKCNLVAFPMGSQRSGKYFKQFGHACITLLWKFLH